ncbi:MAG TPA: LuxR C-terminal-related transcriptional regulator [Candidatus Elarobacter sp.]
MASSRRAALAAVPDRGLLARARAAWDGGEYGRVAVLLGDVRPTGGDLIPALLLHARALLALGRPAEVPAVLDGAGEVTDPELESALQMLRGAALTRGPRPADGETLLAEAAARSERFPERAAEIAYYRALSRWAAHDLGAAEALIDAAQPPPAGVVRSRLEQLRGWIEVRRERYRDAAVRFRGALAALDASDERDAKGRATILHGLSFIAAETVDPDLGELVRSAYAANPWSDDTRIERFQVLEHLSWLSLLGGDVERAWDERQLALTITVDTSYHAIALIHAAKIAGMVGDRFSERRYLQLAGALLLRGDQTSLDVERRNALLGFVTAARAPQAATARDVMTLYDRSAPRRTAMLAFEGDRRIDALELHARGRLALIDGETKDGIAALQRSLELWSALGYELRAAIVAHELLAATGERRYAQRALEALRDAPAAWLRPALAEPASPLAQLTPAERRVLAELCKGKKAREIADEFGRSFNTINNHTRAIFGAFGVRSRSALVAKCAGLGLLER